MQNPEIVTVEKIVTVPEIVTVEKIVTVPEIITVEKIVHVPQVITVEKIVHVPEVITVEKIVHVPNVITIEKIINTQMLNHSSEDEEGVTAVPTDDTPEEEKLPQREPRTPPLIVPRAPDQRGVPGKALCDR